MNKERPRSAVKDLLLLFSIPAGIALLAALAVYVPRMMAKPAYDFIYTYCESYDCATTYAVNSNGVIEKQPIDSTNGFRQREAVLMYYDVSDDARRVLSYEDARGYKLSTSSKSPDGYSLSRNSGSSGFLFWHSSNDGWRLENGMKQRDIQLNNSSSYYSDDVKFLGWVTP